MVKWKNAVPSQNPHFFAGNIGLINFYKWFSTIWTNFVFFKIEGSIKPYVYLEQMNSSPQKIVLGQNKYSPWLTCQFFEMHAFFISNTFTCNARLKLAKDQANAKQHPQVELLLFENYSHSSFTLSSKNNETYSKK